MQLHFDYHMQLSFVTKLTSEDCVFIFSHSGKTKESINLARQVKNQRKMITLTGNSGSELAGLSDEAIIVVTEEGLFRAESLASRISYLTVMDILYTNTMYHNFDQNADSLKKSATTLARLRPIRIICRKEKSYLLVVASAPTLYHF